MDDLETAAAAAAAVVLRDAAKDAARVIAVAAQTAASSGDHDALIELRGDVRNLSVTNADNHVKLLDAIRDVKDTVRIQNGRVGKLETWKAQVLAVGGVLILAQAGVLFTLDRLFGK